ncbi:YbfB/YjiJ family MFS transporter [Staphylococcus sp. ACRSN]|uniref:YbfB/YjiJ family MFS transporter n=1 Tax=Staphylococcus sp. ACRSN TaxID=2918214 RepID=UPI001EF22A25|nr:YbfB/YjiJ family MFS transporter [Staphylococcus sp. ACRSN]MCG7339917.1 YbfB/YjiJ family MFS transporter [Staphylococcus sp. ACRSN]
MLDKTHKQLISGMVALFIVMAISRFAFTPLLPIMQSSTHLNSQTSGYLATSNYLGYLIGAIIPMWFIMKSKAIDLKLYLLINIVSTVLMGMSDSYIVWLVLRLIGGITSGTVFVLASNIVLDALRQAHKESISGLLYSAVGMGLFVSSIYIFFVADSVSWQALWITLGIFSMIISLYVFITLKDNVQMKMEDSKTHRNFSTQTIDARFKRYFYIAYFCEGAGYIITGTFLVVIVKSIPQFADYAALSWMFVGLGAIPSTILWSMIADKITREKAIYLAFILQIVGVCLPILSHNIVSIIISSILFGGTFLGLTTLFLSQGQTMMYQYNTKTNFVASLTVIYSIGQMVAPSISGVLIGESGNYNLALGFATIILLVGLISSVKSYNVMRKLE